MISIAMQGLYSPTSTVLQSTSRCQRTPLSFNNSDNPLTGTDALLEIPTYDLAATEAIGALIGNEVLYPSLGQAKPDCVTERCDLDQNVAPGFARRSQAALAGSKPFYKKGERHQVR
jgi:hypothetical protein